MTVRDALEDALLVIGACLAVYGSVALTADFTYDDRFAIVENRDVRPVDAWGKEGDGGRAGWLELLVHDFWGQDIAGDGSHKSYRPLTVALFRVEDYVARWLARSLGASTKAQEDALAPAVYHSVALALHCACSVLVMLLAHRLFAPVEDVVDHPLSPRMKALVAGLLFALHPIHTEAVCSGVGQADLLSCLLWLLAVHFWVSFVRAKGTVRRALLYTSFALAPVAGFAKETGITVLAAFVAHDVLLPREQAFVVVFSANSNGPHSPKRAARMSWEGRAIRASMCVTILSLYIGARHWVTGGSQIVAILRKVENCIPFHYSRRVRLLTMMQLHGLYFGLLLFPYYLSADWSYACVSYVESAWDARLLPAWLLYGLLLFLLLGLRPWQFSLRTLSFTGGLEDRLMAFVAGALMVVPFLPSSNIFFDVGTAIGERLLYAPSVGFCLLLTHFLAAFVGSLQSRRAQASVLPFLLVTLLLSYGMRTHSRARDWQDDGALFTSAMRVCPQSAKVQLNYGVLQLQRMNQTGALAHFDEAQRIEPTFCDPDYWRAKAVSDRSIFSSNMTMLAESIPIYKKALNCKWNKSKALVQLSKIYGSLIKMDPNNGNLHEEWANLLTRPEIQDLKTARKHLEQAAVLHVNSNADFSSAWRAVSLADKLDQTTALPTTQMERAGNQCGQSVNQCGQPVNQCGQPVNQCGQPVNQCGQPVNQCGQRVNQCNSCNDICGPARVSQCGQAGAASGLPLGFEKFCKMELKTLTEAVELYESVKRHSTSFDSRLGIAGLKPLMYSYMRSLCPKQSAMHELLVHFFQKQDSMDPWLHRAWAEVLKGRDRRAEAVDHLLFAAQLFMSPSDDLTDLDLWRLSQERALEEALECLDDAPVLPAEEAERRCEVAFWRLRASRSLARITGIPRQEDPALGLAHVKEMCSEQCEARKCQLRNAQALKDGLS